MNTLKKFVTIIILITLILFFVHTFLQVEKFGTRVIEHNTVTYEVDPDDSACAATSADNEPNTEGTYMYNYEEVPNFSEYILKTQIPALPDMSKYTLKTNLKPSKAPKKDDTKKVNNSSPERVINKTARKIAQPVKRVVKRAVKPVKRAVKPITKPIKQVVDKTVKTVENPINKIASELNKVVSYPTKIEPDTETQAKLEKTKRNSDLVTKSNVTTLGKNTENGNEIVFKFDRILPDNLTYKKKTKCIHSPVRGDDNSNEVPQIGDDLFKRVIEWFRKLF